MADWPMTKDLPDCVPGLIKDVMRHALLEDSPEIMPTVATALMTFYIRDYYPPDDWERLMGKFCAHVMAYAQRAANGGFYGEL